MEPIVCECGKPIGNLYDAFYFMRRKHDDEHILKSLRVTDLCCRKSFIGCVDFYKLRNGDYEDGKRISDLPRDNLQRQTIPSAHSDVGTAKKVIENVETESVASDSDSGSSSDEPAPPKKLSSATGKGGKKLPAKGNKK